jgi:hypothetical protein
MIASMSPPKEEASATKSLNETAKKDGEKLVVDGVLS